MLTMEPFRTERGQGRAVWHMGALMVFKATSAQTGNQFWLAEQTSNAGYASPVHVHSREDETFYLLDGALSVEVGDTMHQLEPGTCAVSYTHLTLPTILRV